MSWGSFWIGVAAIPALLVALAILGVALYWAAVGLVWVAGRIKDKAKVNVNAHREGLAAWVLSRGGRSMYGYIGPLAVILSVGKPTMTRGEQWELRGELERNITMTRKVSKL
ncbi:hypothetical protein [Brevibacterium album]|uniref:hypothetical protein n=1 Tax=Brevibacterium album TaxID=417948 RepID=UPI00049147C0|nr:hypothetical protein [Brevibacterium album]